MQDLSTIVPPAVVASITARTIELDFQMACEPLVGAFLRTLATTKPGGRFLELGTGTGMSAAWLLEGMDSTSTLVSVDVNPDVQAVAQESLGDDARLTLVLSDGLEYLQNQPPHSFDFVFADAMPGKYEGLDEALAVVKPGGFYFIDDLLPQASWPEGHAAKVPVLIETLATHHDFFILPIRWASGVIVAVRKNPT